MKYLGYIKCLLTKELNIRKHTSIDFSLDKILVALNKIPTSSATGTDGVPSKLLIKAAVPISKLFLIIGESSKDTAMFQGGDRSDPAQYRPIALTSHLEKTLERVCREYLVDYMMIYDLFDLNQQG